MIWRATDRRSQALGLALGAVFAAYFGLYAAATLIRPDPFRFGDFFAFWSYGQVLADHPAAELYDYAALVARQVALGMPQHVSNPFPYPPSFLPVVWPLGLASYTAGYAAFMGLTFALYVTAVVAGAPSLPLALLAVLAPTSILTLVAGQTGFLAAALFLGGMRLLPTRPLLAGVLLGLLAYKPQLGVLVPVALIAAGCRRTIVSAVATVAVVALATSAAFGWHIWADWLAYLPAYATQFEHESTLSDPLMPTLTAFLRPLGIAADMIRAAQAVLALLAAIWVFQVFRRESGPRAMLVLATATILATPHAFVYDLPMLTGAILLFAAERARIGLSTPEVAALILALIFPAVLVHAGAALPIGPACLLLLAAVLIGSRERPNAPA